MPSRSPAPATPPGSDVSSYDGRWPWVVHAARTTASSSRTSTRQRPQIVVKRRHARGVGVSGTELATTLPDRRRRALERRRRADHLAAPDLAVGPDGRAAPRVHRAGRRRHGRRVPRTPTTTASTWSAPVSVADPARRAPTSSCRRSPSAPTASATPPGGRAEVVYLDDRDDGRATGRSSTAFAQFSGDAAPDARRQPLARSPRVAHRARRGRAAAGWRCSRRPRRRRAERRRASRGGRRPRTGDPAKLYRSRLNHGSEAAGRSPTAPSARARTSPVGVARPLRRDRRRRRPGARQHHRRAGARQHAGHDLHARRRATPAPDVMTLLRRRRPAARRHAAADRDRQRRAGAARRQDAAAASRRAAARRCSSRPPTPTRTTSCATSSCCRSPSQLANGGVTVTTDGLLTVRAARRPRAARRSSTCGCA